MNKKLVPLCRCNKCAAIYEDTNPTGETVESIVPKNFPKLKDHKCPECNTDGYLADIDIGVVKLSSLIDEEFPMINDILKWAQEGIDDAEKVKDSKSKRLFAQFKKQILEIFNERARR